MDKSPEEKPKKRKRSSSSSSGSDSEKEKRKRKKQYKKDKRKIKKKMKKLKKKLKRKEKEVIKDAEEQLKVIEDKSDQEDKTEVRSMAPMTKEEWEKRQSVVRRVLDESTGRYRLIKGDGEVIEEIVSRDRHKEINKQATKGDGDYFQSFFKK